MFSLGVFSVAFFLAICPLWAEPDCSARPETILIDTATNSTPLITSITEEYNTWNLSTRYAFNSYFNRIRNVVYKSSPYSTPAEKINALIVIFQEYNKNNKASQKVLWDVEIRGWNGTIAAFIECGNATDGVTGEPTVSLPTDSTGEVTLPSGSTEEITIPTEPTGEITIPSDSTGEITLPTDPTGEATLPSDSTGEFTLPSDSAGEVTLPTDPTGEVTLPSDPTGESSATGEPSTDLTVDVTDPTVPTEETIEISTIVPTDSTGSSSDATDTSGTGSDSTDGVTLPSGTLSLETILTGSTEAVTIPTVVPTVTASDPTATDEISPTGNESSTDLSSNSTTENTPTTIVV